MFVGDSDLGFGDGRVKSGSACRGAIWHGGMSNCRHTSLFSKFIMIEDMELAAY